MIRLKVTYTAMAHLRIFCGPVNPHGFNIFFNCRINELDMHYRLPL